MNLIISDCIWVAIAALCIYLYKYLIDNYYDITLFELLYYTKMPLKGANAGPFTKEIPGILFSEIFAVVFVALTDLFIPKVKIEWKFLGIFFIIFTACCAIRHFHAIKFIILSFSHTKLYDEEYVDPKNTDISFPEKKRNLVYIFMESMETCYSKLSNEKVEYMAELSKLALKGHDFSKPGKINGAHTVPGATYTTGAMLAHLSGVPISQMVPGTLFGEKKFVPNLTTLGDILHEQGYEQEFILGSDITFGGRRPLMEDHGNQKIFDYLEAKKQGRIPKDYRVFWGMEDEKLFDNARLEMDELSKKGKPFAMTILTVDTHFLDGYKCRLCPDTFDTQYGNAIACSSKQVTDFLEWLKQQPYFEDTTVVLVGDHPTMDSGFIKKAGLRGLDRKSYVTYLNLPEGLGEKEEEHEYTTLDLFPTTVASLGAKITGDKLGLGVNLFSKEKTLYERIGKDKLEDELTKRSEYYKRFL